MNDIQKSFNNPLRRSKGSPEQGPDFYREGMGANEFFEHISLLTRTLG